MEHTSLSPVGTPLADIRGVSADQNLPKEERIAESLRQIQNPYGYRKDPDNCHRLLVNEDTAPIVRQIFQRTVDGVPLNEVVKRLNEGGVMTPGHYLAHIGLITSQRLMGSGKWQTWTVGKILDSKVYTGDMVQGKHTNTNG